MNRDWQKTGIKIFPNYLHLPNAFYGPSEIAAAAIYWLADESGPVSGQVMEPGAISFYRAQPSEKCVTNLTMPKLAVFPRAFMQALL